MIPSDRLKYDAQTFSMLLDEVCKIINIIMNLNMYFKLPVI